MSVEDDKVLYGVLPALSKDGKIRVGRVECFEINLEEDMYWPLRAGAGDEIIGDMRPSIPEALTQAAKSVNHDLRIMRQTIAKLEKKLAAIQVAIAYPDQVHLSKREKP